MLSKYTIIHNNTKLEQKWEKMQKGETDANPPWGDGEWARKSLIEMIIFIIIGYNISKLNYALWSLLSGIQRLTTSL